MAGGQHGELETGGGGQGGGGGGQRGAAGGEGQRRGAPIPLFVWPGKGEMSHKTPV